jgi:hypothetical protein
MVMTEKELLMELLKLNVQQTKLLAEQINNNKIKYSQNVYNVINQIELTSVIIETQLHKYEISAEEMLAIVK